MSDNNHNPETATLAETENLSAWKADEPDGETTSSHQLGRATINFFEEEWVEFVAMLADLDSIQPDEDGLYMLEFDNVDVWMDQEDWTEFKDLADGLK